MSVDFRRGRGRRDRTTSFAEARGSAFAGRSRVVGVGPDRGCGRRGAGDLRFGRGDAARRPEAVRNRGPSRVRARRRRSAHVASPARVLRRGAGAPRPFARRAAARRLPGAVGAAGLVPDPGHVRALRDPGSYFEGDALGGDAVARRPRVRMVRPEIARRGSSLPLKGRIPALPDANLFRDMRERHCPTLGRDVCGFSRRRMGVRTSGTRRTMAPENPMRTMSLPLAMRGRISGDRSRDRPPRDRFPIADGRRAGSSPRVARFSLAKRRGLMRERPVPAEARRGRPLGHWASRSCE